MIIKHIGPRFVLVVLCANPGLLLGGASHYRKHGPVGLLETQAKPRRTQMVDDIAKA